MTRFVKRHISLTRNMTQLSLRGSVATAAIPKIEVRMTIVLAFPIGEGGGVADGRGRLS